MSAASSDVGDLFSRFGIADRLSLRGAGQLADLVDLIATDEHAPTTVREPDEVWQVHIADSLSGVGAVVDSLGDAIDGARIADLGAGAGFPGLVLAIALPEIHVTLVESVGKKCMFMDRMIEQLEIDNARTFNGRAEELAASRPPAGGREAFGVVTARALSSLPALLELSSPLLADGGTMVAWRGARDEAEEADAVATGAKTAMVAVDVEPVTPYPGSKNRHIHRWRKQGETPAGLPRRPGQAQKRPLG